PRPRATKRPPGRRRRGRRRETTPEQAETRAYEALSVQARPRSRNGPYGLWSGDARTTRPHQPAQRVCRRWLGQDDPGQPDDAAPPARPAGVLGEENAPEQGRNRRLEREDQRGARGGRPRLPPGRDQVAERTGEYTRDGDRVPGLRRVRKLDLPGDRR